MNRLISSLTTVVLLTAAAPASAQEVWPDGWGFQWQIGYKSIGDSWGDLLSGGADADINIFYNLKKFRIGAGGNFASYAVHDSIASDESLSNVELHGLFNYHFLRGRFQPYVQGRITWRRFRLEGHESEFIPPDPDEPEEPEEGENVADRRAGFGGGVAAGFEWRISYAIGLEAIVSYDRFQTEDLVVEALGDRVFNSGSNWGARVGINWHP